MCTHHIFTVLYSLIFSSRLQAHDFVPYPCFCNFHKDDFTRASWWVLQLNNPKKASPPKWPVRNEHSNANLLVFISEESHDHISERFLLQTAQDIKSGNSVVMILQDRTFHQISKLGPVGLLLLTAKAYSWSMPMASSMREDRSQLKVICY